MLKTILNTV